MMQAGGCRQLQSLFNNDPCDLVLSDQICYLHFENKTNYHYHYYYTDTYKSHFDLCEPYTALIDTLGDIKTMSMCKIVKVVKALNSFITVSVCQQCADEFKH